MRRAGSFEERIKDIKVTTRLLGLQEVDPPERSDRPPRWQGKAACPPGVHTTQETSDRAAVRAIAGTRKCSRAKRAASPRSGSWRALSSVLRLRSARESGAIDRGRRAPATSSSWRRPRSSSFPASRRTPAGNDEALPGQTQPRSVFADARTPGVGRGGMRGFHSPAPEDWPPGPPWPPRETWLLRARAYPWPPRRLP